MAQALACRVLASSELTCAACDNTLQEPVSLPCGHSYCRSPCIGAVMQHNQARCMQCLEPVNTQKLRVSTALHATITALRSISAQDETLPSAGSMRQLTPSLTKPLDISSSSLLTMASSSTLPANAMLKALGVTQSAGALKVSGQGLLGVLPGVGEQHTSASLHSTFTTSASTPSPSAALLDEEWTCSVCTMKNAGLDCEACSMPAPDEWLEAKGLKTSTATTPPPTTTVAAPTTTAPAPPARELTPWERGEYSAAVAAGLRSSPVEEEWHTTGSGGKGASSGPSASSSKSFSASGGGGSSSAMSGGSSSGLSPSTTVDSSSGGVPTRPSVTGLGVGSVSRLIPLVGEEYPPNAVQKTSGAGSSFSGKGKGGGPGSGLLVRFNNGIQCRGMVLTVMTGANVKKGSHVHGFIGITRSKNRELFDHILESCPEGVREFRNGYSPNTRHATLTFQFPDLVLTDEEKKYEEFGANAAKVMDDLLCKEVFFEVLWSPRWGRFVAHNVYLVPT